jgi:WD40 repeat protein
MSSSISEMTTVKPCKTIRGHTHHVQGVVHLPDERHIITGSGDGSLRLWELQSGTQVGKDWRDEEDKTLVTAIALSPNGTAVASGGFDGKVRLWDVETGKVIGKWTAHSDTVASVCWSTDGKRVLSGSGDAERNSGTARVWDIKSSKTILEIKTGSDNGSWVAIYSPDSLKIATVGKTVATIWDAKTGKLLSRVPTPADLSSMVWMSDGKKLVGGSKNSIMIFDTSTLQKITTLEGHRSWVHVIALSRNERLLVSASYDYTAHLWNLDTNLPVGPALEHERTVLCAAISADGKLLVTGCDDNNVYVWDLHAILNKAGLEDLLSIPDVSFITLR